MAQLVTKANSLIIIAFILVFGVIGLLYVQYDAQVRDTQSWVDHTYTVQAHIKDLWIAMDEAETGQRGYLLTGDDAYLTPYQAARDRSALLYGELKNLTADNQTEQDRLTKLSPLMQRRLALIASSIAARKAAAPGAAQDLSALEQGREVQNDIRTILIDMTNAESKLLFERLVEVATVRTRTAILASAGGAAAFFLLIIGGVMIRRAARDRRLAELAVRDSANQLRLSFDSLSQGIVVFDASRHVTNWNQCFVSLLGLSPDVVRLGAHYNDIAAALAPAGGFFETEAQLDAAPLRAAPARSCFSARAPMAGPSSCGGPCCRRAVSPSR